MGLLKTQKECLLFSWGKLLKENKGLFLLSLSSLSGKDAKRLFSAGWKLLQLKGWILREGWDVHPQDSHQIGVEDVVLGLKGSENSHTHNNNHRAQKLTKEVNTQTDSKNQCSVPPPISLLYWFLVLDEVKCKTHTQQQT